jgi:hypothetical protein
MELHQHIDDIVLLNIPYGTPSPNLAGCATAALRSFFTTGDVVADEAAAGFLAATGAAAAAAAAEPPANSPT